MPKIKSINISLNDPCTEDWNTMTPTEQGRFCNACTKEVIDFTQMTDAQVIDYVKEKGIHFCGRFRPTQLDRPMENTSVPFYCKWWKAAAAMVAMLSVKNANAQDSPIFKDSCFTGENAELSYSDPARTNKIIHSDTGFIIKGKVTLNGMVLKTCTITVFADHKLVHTMQVDSSGQYEIRLDPALLSEITLVRYKGPINKFESRSFQKSDFPSVANVDFVLPPFENNPISQPIHLSGVPMIRTNFKISIPFLNNSKEKKYKQRSPKEKTSEKKYKK